jgi:hypothetical protein
MFSPPEVRALHVATPACVTDRLELVRHHPNAHDAGSGHAAEAVSTIHAFAETMIELVVDDGLSVRIDDDHVHVGARRGQTPSRSRCPPRWAGQ